MASPGISTKETHVSYRSTFTHRYLKSLLDQYTCLKCSGHGMVNDDQEVCRYCKGLGLTGAFTIYSPVQESKI